MHVIISFPLVGALILGNSYSLHLHIHRLWICIFNETIRFSRIKTSLKGAKHRLIWDFSMPHWLQAYVSNLVAMPYCCCQKVRNIKGSCCHESRESHFLSVWSEPATCSNLSVKHGDGPFVLDPRNFLFNSDHSSNRSVTAFICEVRECV